MPITAWSRAKHLWFINSTTGTTGAKRHHIMLASIKYKKYPGGRCVLISCSRFDSYLKKCLEIDVHPKASRLIFLPNYLRVCIFL